MCKIIAYPPAYKRTDAVNYRDSWVSAWFARRLKIQNSAQVISLVVGGGLTARLEPFYNFGHFKVPNTGMGNMYNFDAYV